ncbi:MAG: hypothetical protein AAGA33_10070 [Pseudomonadota bacterium]
MSDALWLFVGLPQWFFLNLLEPLAVVPLSVVPFIGIVCLAIGAVLGLRKRARSLWKFALPVLASHVLVAVSGLFRGALDGSQVPAVVAVFLAIILGWSSLLVFKAKGSRLAAGFLALFTLSYAAFAAFISGMSFTDTWL